MRELNEAACRGCVRFRARQHGANQVEIRASDLDEARVTHPHNGSCFMRSNAASRSRSAIFSSRALLIQSWRAGGIVAA
jgi:hypothetical protein